MNYEEGSPRNRIEAWFSSFVIDHPWRALALGLALFVAIAPGLPHFEEEFDYRTWLNEDDPSLLQYDEFQETFGSELAIAVVMHSPSGIFEPDTAEVLIELTEAMWRIPHTIRVESLSNYQWTRAAAGDIQVGPMIPDDRELTRELLQERREASLNHELLPNYLVSEDAKTAMVYAQLTPFVSTEDEHEAVEATRDALADDFEGIADLEFHLTGEPVIYTSVENLGAEDGERMMGAMLGAMLLLLIVIIRRIRGVIPTPLVLGLSAASGLALMGYLGYPATPVTNLVPMIAVAIIAANAIHILSSYLRALRAGMDNVSALRVAQDNTHVTTFFACVTTAFAFLGFIPSEIATYRHVGIGTTLSLVCGWVFLQLILMPLLRLIPLRKHPPATTDHAEERTPSQPAPWAVTLQQWLVRRRALVITAFAAVTVASAVAAQKTKITTDYYDFFLDDHPQTQAISFVESEFGWASTVDIVVDSGEAEGIKKPEFLHEVESLQDWMWQNTPVVQLHSFVDLLKMTNRALNEGRDEEYRIPDSRPEVAEQHFLYTMNLPQGLDLNNQVSPDNRFLRITGWWPVRFSHEGLEQEEAILAKMEEIGLDGYVTGRAQVWNDMGTNTARTILYSIGIALALVILVLIILFRSFTLGLLAVIPNLIPLVVSAGVLGLLGIKLDFYTALGFALALGIAVDDNVHFMSTYHVGRKRGLNVRDAVTRAISLVGPPMLKSTVVLVAAFGVLWFSLYAPNHTFSLLVLCALISAFITDMLLVPALLLLRSKWQ